MRISDVAKIVDLPVSTIRYYERKGIINKPARQGVNRSFSEKDVRALQFVRDARSIGFSLKHIEALLSDIWNARKVAELASRQRQVMQKKIETLQRMEKSLLQLEGCVCKTLDQCRVQACISGAD